jgi:hypothetical protein
MLSIALLLALSGAIPGPDQDGCRRCDFRGVTDCPQHDDELRELEPTVFCSVAAACADCGGSMVLDCEHCDGGPENAAMEARRAELAAWAAVPHPLETELGLQLIRIENERFELAGSISKLKRGKHTVDGHTFFHHLARDGSRTAALIDEHYQVNAAEDYRARMRLWLWHSRDEHLRVMSEHLNSGSTGDYKLLGKDPIFSACSSDPLFNNDYDVLLSLGVHNAAHMLTSNLFQEEWIGLEGAGWFDVGLAHWYEEQVIGRHRHYCVDEAHGPWKWNDPLWRAKVRKYLDKEKDRQITQLVGMQTGEVPDWGHAVSWSFYDWIVATKPAALRPILIGLKQKVPTRELIRDHVGLDLFAAEDAWREWVIATYPRKEKPTRR